MVTNYGGGELYFILWWWDVMFVVADGELIKINYINILNNKKLKYILFL